jgi:mono/diheme cytochrome c family protein
MKVALLGIAMMGLIASTARAADAPAPAADLGEHVYTTICQGCHMANGEGATGAATYPSLVKNPRLVAWQYVALTILQGRRAMPPFGGVPDVEPAVARMAGALTDEQIAAVVNYIRTRFGTNIKDKISAKDVKALPHPGDKGSGRAG